MEIEELRLGNLIKISPRPKEEGILFLAEIHPLNIIGVMLIPRQGYHFRIKFNEMIPLELTEDWLVKFGFNKTGNSSSWVDNKNIEIRFTKPGACFIIENGILGSKIQYAHQLQNQYFLKTGEELAPKI